MSSTLDDRRPASASRRAASRAVAARNDRHNNRDAPSDHAGARDSRPHFAAPELSHAAAAEIMGIKEATVSFHVHAARKTLRGLL